MKTTRTIKNLLFAGVVSLTLASCGGGGADDAIDKVADIIDKNTNTQSGTLAPDALTAGMKFYITEASRPDAVLSITSATACTDSISGECTYTYRKITDSTGKLNLQWDNYAESYTLAFKNSESGNAVWIWSMDGKEQVEDVKFRLEGRSNTSNSPSDEDAGGSVPPATTPDTPADDSGASNNSGNIAYAPSAPNDDLAPSSLANGMQIAVARYLTFRQTNGNRGVVTVSNVPYDAQINYRKTGKNTATLNATYMAPSSRGTTVQHTAVVNLTFKASDNGSSQYTIENMDSFSYTNGIRKVSGGGQFRYEKYNP